MDEQVSSLANLRFEVAPGEGPTLETGMDMPQVDSQPIGPADFESPRVVPIQLRPAIPRIISFAFAESPGLTPPAAEAAKPDSTDKVSGKTEMEPSAGEEGPSPPRPTITRIKPPGDIVRLEDRLYYVLQPPLESLARTNSLTFPFEPFPYQYQGMAFLFPRYSAVLADEMGLGKTMQAISTIRMLLCAGEVSNVLLICPKPLVTNWKREFALWAPEVPIAIVEGDQAKRRWQWDSAHTPVRIANYEVMMRDRDWLEQGAHFDLVILDEAQRIKNPSSTTAEIIRSIPRTRSWALTGTPIENSPDDLVGIFEFLSPGSLKKGMPLRQMAEVTRDHMIRRTKDMVLTDMPPKLFRDAELDLAPEQRATYEMAENEGVLHLNELEEQITIQHVFELVLRLKQICNFDPVTGASSKMERLEADLEEVAASGKKAIVFSQWVNTIEKIDQRLGRFHPLQYHGKIPSAKRDGILKEFKENKSRHVLLMSYGAGSVGLNLQFCEYVFLFDRWWNPAVEDQAINRAHRIGAAGPVTVTRMLSMETIETRINEILEEKREMFNAIFSEDLTPTASGLTASEIFGLFKLRTHKGPIKAVA
jgi:SNF2 family DNA or RNA helicase